MTALAGEDSVLPFVIETAGVRGRVIRLGPALREILGRHDYPPQVSGLLSEFLLLAGCLSSMMKYEGIFTLQIRGDGPLRLIVADVDSNGALRGYVDWNEEDLERVLERDERPSLPRLCGTGYLAFTVDRNDEGKRYQGIVELEGASLADCVLHYFRQSEQLPSAIHLAKASGGDPGQAAGMILQRLPASQYGSEHPDILEAREEGWRRATILMATLTDEELLDPAVPPAGLVYRLFNEEEVTLYEPTRLKDQCRCSRERLAGVLASMSAEDLAAMTLADGRLEAVCQFCSRRYDFSPETVRDLEGRGEQGEG